MTMPARRARRVRAPYDRTYDRLYPAPALPPPVPREPGVGLVPVTWHGLNINPGWIDEQFTAIVERVTGWYATPPLHGNDSELVLADGGTWGPKVLGMREVTITGAAVGPRPQLMDWRDQLAFRAAMRQPAELEIGDPWLGTALTTMTRAGTNQFEHEFFAGPKAWRFTVTLLCADPLLYTPEWRQVVLTTLTDADAGRRYDRFYTEHEPELSGWRYGNPYPSGSAGYLANPGNADAPVFAAYAGDLAVSVVTDDVTGSIRGAAVPAGAEFLVATATLTAEAPGGASRASFIMAGSTPMVIPARTTQRWHLYSQGSGSVTLAWRPAWV